MVAPFPLVTKIVHMVWGAVKLQEDMLLLMEVLLIHQLQFIEEVLDKEGMVMVQIQTHGVMLVVVVDGMVAVAETELLEAVVVGMYIHLLQLETTLQAAF